MPVGVPGTQLLRSLTINDLHQRVKTMQGYQLRRSRGLSCHGLDLEQAVSTELGLTGKAEIEAYGLGPFVRRCRESALRHAAAFDAIAERIGCRTAPATSYLTMDTSYVESVWWSLKQAFDAGLLVRDSRLAWYCPGCQTALAEHDLRRPGVFRMVPGTSAVVRFRLTELPSGAGRPSRAGGPLRGTDLLAWTTAPWLLTANAGIAVGTDEVFAIARRAGQDDQVVVAESRFGRVLGEGWHIADRITGAELAGARYQPAFATGPAELPVVSIAAAGLSGTGLTLLAPAYGGGEALTDEPLATVDPLGPDGRFGPALSRLHGVFFADANPAIIANLGDRGLLFAAWPQSHRLACCSWCGSPLLTRNLSSWYLRASAISAELAAQASWISWPPAPAVGVELSPPLGARFSADWLISRTRYWGTPLPIWECGHGHLSCVSSLAELSELAKADLLGIDPHRPAIDAIQICCRTCGLDAHRVPDVLDAGYDAGAMPFAQFGAPQQQMAEFAASVPAALAADSGQHPSGWFSALITIGVIAHGQAPFQAGLWHGGVSDEAGRWELGKAI